MALFKRKSACHGTSSPVPCGVRRVALVGYPNVGKSVLFNALTGAYVTVSNYPGTSVEVSKGTAVIDGETFEIVDTPGMYSLLPITEEERVAREMLLDGPDMIIHVVDARNIERMMPMTLQLMEAGLPVTLVVNIMDEAERLGLSIDVPLLERRLGIPVRGAAIARKRGLPEIRKAIVDYRRTKQAIPPYSKRLEHDIEDVASLLHGEYALAPRATALLLLQRDEEITRLVEAREGSGYAALEKMVREKSFMRRESFHLDLSVERKRLVKEILDGVFIEPLESKIILNERISRFAVQPLTGIFLLAVVLYYGLYKFVGVFGAGTLVDFLEGTMFEEYFNPWITAWVERLVPWWAVRELFVGEYGVITLGMRYAIGIILPIVATFFLFFSILEDSGYFPRLALLVDRLFKMIGLSGRAVIPMVLGFGCDTMATMVTRTLETVRERIIATLLLALAIPCSAQLGVIMALLAGEPRALSIWIVCILLIFLVVGFLAAQLIPGDKPMFYMELPPMRMPQLSNVLTKTYARMQWYLLEILPLFMLASVLLWIGKITFFFNKLADWGAVVMSALGLPREAAVAFIFGFFRRDYGAAGLFDLHGKGLLNPRQMTVAAVTLTLFIPCIAQFLIIKKERGLKIAAAIGLFVTFIAFVSGYLLNKLILSTGML